MTSDPTAEQQVRDLARVGVRAGLLGTDELHAEVVHAIATDLPDRADDADDLADTWIEEARAQLRVDQESWPAEADDLESLQSAFAELELLDVVVLQACADQTAAQRAIEEPSGEGGPAGVLWFTRADVRRAVDEGRLEITLWHGTATVAGPGDELLDDVLGALEKHGLEARFDDGRVVADVRWHKRIAP